MSFKDLAEQMVTAGFHTFGEPAAVIVGGGDPISASVIISRGADVLDDYGVIVDSRTEVELRISEVGSVSRGDTVTPEDGSGALKLFERINENGSVTRWIANEV